MSRTPTSTSHSVAPACDVRGDIWDILTVRDLQFQCSDQSYICCKYCIYLYCKFIYYCHLVIKFDVMSQLSCVNETNELKCAYIALCKLSALVVQSITDLWLWLSWYQLQKNAIHGDRYSAVCDHGNEFIYNHDNHSIQIYSKYII